MADDGKRQTFPSIPAKNWWDLRSQFKKSLPGKVDSDYLQSVLGVGEGHAKNLIPQLTIVGLIGEDGKLTPRAEDWRDDATYNGACEAILKEVYPPGLLEALPPPDPLRSSVEQWFMRNAKVGQGAAGKMATFYLLLCLADVNAQSGTAAKGEARRKSTNRRVVPRRARPAAAQRREPVEVGTTGGSSSEDGGGRGVKRPSVHVDVQVHISPDATAEQIDNIFASMAKHFYSDRS